MKWAVWKFELPNVPGEFSLDMPFGARVVHVAAQRHKPVLWAIVDMEAPLEMRYFRLYETGEILFDPLHQKYLGTLQLVDGSYVLHLFVVDHLPIMVEEDEPLQEG